MKRKVCSVLNLMYSLLCLVAFLIQNGCIILPGTTKYNGISEKFKDSFVVSFRFFLIVMAIIGIGLVIFDFLVQKELSSINKVGCIMGLCVVCFTIACIFAIGAVPITSVAGIIASVFMLIRKNA